MNQTPPLASLQVLELSGHVAGAYCGKLMAGFGAELVQIDGGHDAALDDAAQTWFHTAKRRLPADAARDRGALKPCSRAPM